MLNHDHLATIRYALNCVMEGYRAGYTVEDPPVIRARIEAALVALDALPAATPPMHPFEEGFSRYQFNVTVSRDTLGALEAVLAGDTGAVRDVMRIWLDRSWHTIGTAATPQEDDSE